MGRVEKGRSWGKGDHLGADEAGWICEPRTRECEQCRGDCHLPRSHERLGDSQSCRKDAVQSCHIRKLRGCGRMFGACFLPAGESGGCAHSRWPQFHPHNPRRSRSLLFPSPPGRCCWFLNLPSLPFPPSLFLSGPHLSSCCLSFYSNSVLCLHFSKVKITFVNMVHKNIKFQCQSCEGSVCCAAFPFHAPPLCHLSPLAGMAGVTPVQRLGLFQGTALGKACVA